MNTDSSYSLRFFVSISVLGAVCILAGAGCGKSVPSSEALTSYVASGTDANAGSWTYIALSGPTQIPVAAPAAASAPSYLAELQAIEMAQASITTDQQNAITLKRGRRVALERRTAAVGGATGSAAGAESGW